MQLTIFGATGMVGQHIVKQALWAGYNVIAFGRNANVFYADEPKNLTAFKGYLTDVAQIEKAIQGSQAVISAIGSNISTDATDNTRSLGMKNIVTAMQNSGLTKIAAIGGMGILPSQEPASLIYETEHFPQQLIPVTLEHLKAFEYLKASNLAYSFFCPPTITNAICNGNYTVAHNAVANNIMHVTAGNLADAMLKAIAHDNEVGLYGINDK